MGIRSTFITFTTRRSHSILSASLVLGITFALSAILGFIRSRFLYARFFNCCALELDAYNAAFRIPDLIFKLLVTGALSASFIPVFSSHLHRDEKKAYELASNVINLLLLLFIAASVIVLVFTPQLSNIIAAGFNDQQVALMTQLTRILLIAQIFFLISNFATAILQVNSIFTVPSLSPLIYNLFIIASIIFLSPLFGIYGVVYGTVAGAFFHLAIQIPSLFALGFHYYPQLNFRLPGVREVVRLMIPRSLSLGLGEIENTVTLFFASTLAAGSLSLLNLALQLMYLPSRIFGTTVGQASLPILSKNIARNELEQFRSTVKKTLRQSLYIAIPITTLVLIHRLAIIRVAFGSRQFPWSATLLTAKTLAYLTPAIACQAIIQILIRAFYALHNTKTPLKISLVSLTVNILSSFILINFTNLGIVGLAISASLGNITQCVGLFYMFIRRVDGGGWWQTFSTYAQIILASFGLGLGSWLTLRFLDMFVLDSTKTLNVILISTVSSLVGIAIYLYTTYFWQLEEFNDYRRYFHKIKLFLKSNR